MPTVKVQIRIEQIARMRLAGIKDYIIAEQVGLTPAGLSRILALPQYLDIQEALLQGHLTQMDKAIAGRVDILRQEMKPLVPAALRALTDAVTQRRDLRAMLEASKEILDRDPDGTFAKRSKTTADSEPVPRIDPASLTKLGTAVDEVVKKVQVVN